MNCYGYALCNILTGSTIYSEYGGYKQQPGEFAQTADKGKTVDNIVLYNPAASMSNIISNMKLDATRLGYTITEYIPSSSTVTQFGSSSRLIALVTGAKDYHFYMQHNDGTWSHKPGSGAVTNKSLANNSIVLTNSNIIARANEGAYSNGSLKFFVITKSAIIDHPHGTRCCTSWPCSHSQSSLFYSDKAGDYLQTSVTKYTGNTSARMDFAQDHDVYCFTPTTTKTYTISTTCSSDVDIDCKVYNASGSMINSSTSTGQVNLSISLTAGQTYYFDIYNYNQTITGYTFTIN